MVELYRIEDTFRYEGEKYECDVHSHGILEVCTVPRVPEECDVDLDYAVLISCVKWDEELEDWYSIEACDLPEDVMAEVEDEALERFRQGYYKKAGLIGTRE